MSDQISSAGCGRALSLSASTHFSHTKNFVLYSTSSLCSIPQLQLVQAACTSPSSPVVDKSIPHHLLRILRWKNKNKRPHQWWYALLCLVSTAGLTAFLIFAGAHNYPGGQALALLHKSECSIHFQMKIAIYLMPYSLVPTTNVKVHIGNAAAQQGVSRFGQLNSLWTYDKTEQITNFSGFTHLISENKTIEGFTTIHTITAFQRFGLALKSPFLEAHFKPALYILKRSPS